MKKKLDKIYRDLIQKTLVIPMPVLLILVAILNYSLGSAIAKVNKTYSDIQNLQKSEFFSTVIMYIAIWVFLFIMNNLVIKINNMRLLNKNYMKWIERLTFSRVSSITEVGTGGISSAINTIASCDKYMVNIVIAMLPNIMPCILINYEEFKVAGILPVIINIVYIIVMVICNLIAANLKSNEIAAKASAKMRSVTTDCIYNSKTVKYFNKENWSIDRQKDTQNNTYVDCTNLKKSLFVSIVFGALQWIPTILNVYLCWESTSTVLFILMSDYAISNISNNIMDYIDTWGEKKANLKIIGNLKSDDSIKKPIEKSLEVRDVVFKYSKESKVTFKINNISIKKGHRYVITGKSGFGKSTFIKLLTKTIEPDIAGGQIDSVDTIYMFAESEMFNDTVMENISLGDTSVTVSEVKNILDRLEVVLDLDIEHDPVGEKGEALSTGQRQRINLARVIVYARRHPGVLVALDEVTSALDEVTSINCINYIASEFERLGTTLLYVSNKYDYKDTNLITDNIYVVRDGDTVTYIQK